MDANPQAASRRSFSASPLAKGLRNACVYLPADIITDLYVSEIKAYKPSAQVREGRSRQEKIDLPTTFSAPKAPAKPEIEAAPVAAAAEAALTEEAWPALADSIDDPTLYNDEYDIDTANEENLNGKLLPGPLKEFDYDHGHH
ncbi:hypothetical protein HDV03_000666 [Kappamyces sp. JEL0829]|nr:hypothetical protein HDV03_000666 [Kappamyces sp. JEL0829]